MNENINFACKTFSIFQVLKCSFELTNTELELIKLLYYDNEEINIKSLINKLKKDRATIQRSIKKLITKNLIHRRQINLENGGYYFIYSSIPKPIIKKMINEIFTNFTRIVEKEIDNW